MKDTLVRKRSKYLYDAKLC